jgi:hypothetical protein
MMENKFQMSMIGDLTFFLGIQVKKMKEGTFIHQAMYTKYLMKKFNIVHDRRSNLFLRYSSEENEGRHPHTSSHVHKIFDEEVQYG